MRLKLTSQIKASDSQGRYDAAHTPHHLPATYLLSHEESKATPSGNEYTKEVKVNLRPYYMQSYVKKFQFRRSNPDELLFFLTVTPSAI